MNKIAIWDDGDYVIVVADGHSNGPIGGKLCAVVTQYLLVLWTKTGAVGLGGVSGAGFTSLVVSTEYLPYLNFVYFGLATLAQEYPEHLSVTCTSTRLDLEIPECSEPHLRSPLLVP